MTEPPRKLPDSKKTGVLFTEIGLFVADWANLEYMIDEMIWALARLPPAIGACITSQIINVRFRIEALISLMKLRKVDQSLIVEINKFAGSIHGPLEKRNRIVHSPIIFDSEGLPGRLEITAKNAPVFEVKKVSAEQVGTDRNELRELARKLHQFRDHLSAALPTLPKMQHSELQPINLTRVRPK